MSCESRVRLIDLSNRELLAVWDQLARCVPESTKDLLPDVDPHTPEFLEALAQEIEGRGLSRLLG